MKHVNYTCIDAGTENCPCPLAETGDCLVCGRLSGKDKCDCSWCGLCIYNEFVQNGKTASNVRKDIKVKIIDKKWYSSDLLMLTVEAERKLVLNAVLPGSFAFLNATENSFFSVPISVMKADVQKKQLCFGIKVVSAKTKYLATEENELFLRGVYRNGIFGDWDAAGKWLIITRGIGISPAVNLMTYLGDKCDMDIVIDQEKVTEEFVFDCLKMSGSAGEKAKIIIGSLADISSPGIGKIKINDKTYDAGKYDKVAILTSNYYIDLLTNMLNIADNKLVYANNYNMCCGEGICGACCHVDENGTAATMCKCRRK